LALKRPAEALRVADQGLVSLPKSARLQIARGHALTDTHRPDEAIAAFRAAMTYAPGSAEPVTDLALMLLHSERRDEAVVLLKRALEIQPQYADAASALSELELDAGHPEEAAKYIIPFFEQFSGLESARTLMSKLYLARALNAKEQGDFAEVERICREGLASVPNSAELHLLLGIRFARDNRLDDALQEFESSYKLQPDDPLVVLSLGKLYHQLGRDADARRLLTEGTAAAKRSGDQESVERFQQLLEKLSL
jgi:Flp pilus assembly protein TadD